MEEPLRASTSSRASGEHDVAGSTRGASGRYNGIIEQLSRYDYDPQLARNVSVLVAVKNLTQGVKNSQRLDRLRRGIPRIGSPTARPAETGVVGVCRLSGDVLSSSSWQGSIELDDPVGIDLAHGKLAVSSRSRVLIWDPLNQRLEVFSNPWFAALHSVAFSRNGTRLLVASSGYDSIFELSVASGEILWDWNSWEHGYALSVAGERIFSRNKNAPSGTTDGCSLVVVDPLQLGGAGVPIWQRPVHLNGAAYDHDGDILATFFHQGVAVKISKTTKACVELVSGLVKPHAFLPDPDGGYLVTSTGGGEARTLLLDERFGIERSVAPSGLEGVRSGFPASEEWLQYTTSLGPDLYCQVDIHRSSLFLVSPTGRTYRRIRFPRNWAVQMVIRAPLGLRLPAQSLLT